MSPSSCRAFILLFCRTEAGLSKYLSGFNHVTLFEYMDGEYVAIDFTHTSSDIRIFHRFPRPILKNRTAVAIFVDRKGQSRLISPKILQTCTTLAQYLIGIQLYAILADTLYRQLTRKSERWLRKKGIQDCRVINNAKELAVWESQRAH